MHDVIPCQRRCRGDAGVTLIELVVTVAIMGVITVALTGVVISYLRNTADTQARLTESHDVQFASAYWQRDVSSIGVRETDQDPDTGEFAFAQSVFTDAAMACTGLPAGATAVVTLAWSEYLGDPAADPPAAPTTVRVTYAWRDAGIGVIELIRVRCGSDPSVVQVADTLEAVPKVKCDGSAANCTSENAPHVITLELSVRDKTSRHGSSYPATLTGERRQI